MTLITTKTLTEMAIITGAAKNQILSPVSIQQLKNTVIKIKVKLYDFKMHILTCCLPLEYLRGRRCKAELPGQAIPNH